MSEELDRLNKLSDFFKTINYKIKLISLIKKAKLEYDSYDYSSAYESLLKAFKLDKKNPAILRGLGCINQFKGDYSQAIDYYKKALEYSKSKELEYTLIGTVYYIEDKLDEAIKYFNLAIDENDDYEKAYENRNQAILENHMKIVDLQEMLKKYF